MIKDLEGVIYVERLKSLNMDASAALTEWGSRYLQTAPGRLQTSVEVGLL